MGMTKFEVRNRWSGEVQFTAEIEADESTLPSVKLGMALKWAFKSDANLRDADLRDANLRDADLRDADLSGADLSGADLRDANLRDADLRGAYLSGANLRDADLRGANLRGANLRGAYLSGAKGINAYRCTPLLMLLDQPGKIRAYKLVNRYGEGIYRGGLKYEVGHSVSVRDANTEPDTQCGAGINVATLDWCMSEWTDSRRILIVEFEAKDIACIPTATDGKFRLHRCDVIEELDLAKVGLKEADKAEAA